MLKADSGHMAADWKAHHPVTTCSLTQWFSSVVIHAPTSTPHAPRHSLVCRASESYFWHLVTQSQEIMLKILHEMAHALPLASRPHLRPSCSLLCPSFLVAADAAAAEDWAPSPSGCFSMAPKLAATHAFFLNQSAFLCPCMRLLS